MSTISGINGVSDAASYSSYTTTAKKTESAKTTDDTAAVYEASSKQETSKTAKTYTPNTALISKMKADAEAQTANLQSIVEKLISGQGNAYGQANDMWKFLADGNFTVDAATKSQAQADIAEDGYWGVNKTSDRILDFAKALTGGDPSKIEEMKNAFEKGFKEATKAWGKDLPSISNDTYKAVMDKFDQWANENN